MGVLIFCLPLLIGVALVANVRGFRDRFTPPVRNGGRRSQAQVCVLVGRLFLVLPPAALIGAGIHALGG